MSRTHAATFALLAATSLTIPVSATAATDLPPAADRTVTIATYNIHHAAGTDGVLDVERIARVLEDTGASVIGLQEVDNHWGARSDFADQAAVLAELLDMNVCYSANLDNPPLPDQTHRQQYGTAILSSHPLKNCSNTPLPNHPGGEQRGLAQADVRVRGTEFRFFNTHLTHNSSAGRTAQANVMNEIVRASDLPAVLVGDLNAAPESAEYPLFTAELADVWPVVGEGQGYTIEADNPTRRIDYVLASDDIEPVSAQVLTTPASDHLPVVAELVLPHPSQVQAAN
ncbi:endonuclease/exonuclease/phosphatase family protein [Janibacter sp. G1551]|uniref:endonuclease/exonuclease/phosphatase family protein n=1 Tax=Janibacter sp. G1551 TaxID=3420440 RepID=UPI003CFE67A5